MTPNKFSPWSVTFALACISFATIIGAAGSFAQETDSKSTDDQANLMTISHFAPEASSIFLPPPRDILRPLIRAIRIYHEGNLDRSAELIGEFLADSDTEDFLIFSDKENGIAHSVVDLANSMLGQFPDAAIQSLQVRFGIPAKQRLDQAVAKGDFHEIAQVMRRYLYTPAGLEAAQLLGVHHLDSGNPLLAANCFQLAMKRNARNGDYDPKLALLTGISWYHAENEGLAISVFSKLAAESNNLIRIGDREVKFDRDTPAESIVQLLGPHAADRGNKTVAEWLMLGGDPKRNARLPDGFPVTEPLWKVSTIDNRETRKQILDDRNSIEPDSDYGLIPANIPLVADGTVLAGNGKQIRGIDFKTGKRIWTVPIEIETVTSRVNLTAIPNQLFQRNTTVRNTTKTLKNPEPWTDFLQGHLSSDGRRVYRLKEAEIEAGQLNGGFGVRGRNYARSTKVNWLQALDVTREGTVAWQAGIGQSFGDPNLQEVSFLGTPLAVDDELYAIGRRRQEIVLVAINSKGGDLLWMQTLASDEPISGTRYQSRNVKVKHSLTPSYSDGILVCPTGKDALVGVDILSRSLLWGMQANFGKSRSTISNRFGASQSPQLLIDGSKVLGFEVGSGAKLIALDLLTGKSIFSSGKKSIALTNVLHVAGAHENSVIVVEKSRVRCIALNSGRNIWDQSLKNYGQPSGRGYLTKTSFYLPTAQNRIVRLSLKDGNVTNEMRMDETIGNLVIHQGKLISQTETAIACHELASTVETALKNAIDQAGGLENISPRLKVQQASLFRTNQKFNEALILLKTVEEQDHGPTFKREFLRCILATMQAQPESADEFIADYGGWFLYRENPELFFNFIEILVKNGRTDDVIQRLFADDTFFSITQESETPELIRRRASNYQSADNQSNQPKTGSLTDGINHTVMEKILAQNAIEFSPSQWAKAQLILLADIDSDAKSKISQAVDVQLKKTEFESSLDEFEFLRQLPTACISRPTKLELAKALIAENNTAEAENMVAGLNYEATKNGLTNGSPFSAEIKQLEQQLVQLQMGGQRAAQLKPGNSPQVAFNDVEVQLNSKQVQYQQNVPSDVKIEGPYAEKHFNGDSIIVWSRSKELEIIDSLGQSKHRFVIFDGDSQTARYVASGNGWLNSKHSLALLRLRSLLIAIDLSKLDSGADAVLWHRVISTPQSRRIDIAGEINPVINTNLISRTATVSDPLHGCCCFINDKKLECVDAYTGRILWQRRLPLNHTRLIADFNHVISLDSRQRDCHVFDIQTGGHKKTVKIPELADVYWAGDRSTFLTASVVRESRLEKVEGFEDFRGQQDLAAEDANGSRKKRGTSLKSNRIFCRFDVAKGDFVWKKRFAMRAKACRMKGNRLLVLSDDSTVYIFDSLTGETLSQFDSGLTTEERNSVKHVGVTSFCNKELVLIANNKSSSQLVAGIRMRPTRNTNTFFSGHLLLLDGQHAKPVWNRSAEVVGFQILPLLPSGSPLLLLNRHIQSNAARSAKSLPQQIPVNSLQLVGIDWKTGKEVVNVITGTTNVQSYEPARIDLAAGTVKFDMSSRSIQLSLKQSKDLPPAPVASITTFNPVPQRELSPVPKIQQKSFLTDIATLNNALADKAREYEESLAKKREAEQKQLELESKLRAENE
jgi:outer membrane protein assembly factor BamB